MLLLLSVVVVVVGVGVARLVQWSCVAAAVAGFSAGEVDVAAARAGPAVGEALGI